MPTLVQHCLLIRYKTIQILLGKDSIKISLYGITAKSESLKIWEGFNSLFVFFFPILVNFSAFMQVSLFTIVTVYCRERKTFFYL